MAELLDEQAGIVGEVLVVMGGLLHEPRDLVFLQFPYCQWKITPFMAK
jgi:hypothetical protein